MLVSYCRINGTEQGDKWRELQYSVARAHEQAALYHSLSLFHCIK